MFISFIREISIAARVNRCMDSSRNRDTSSSSPVNDSTCKLLADLDLIETHSYEMLVLGSLLTFLGFSNFLFLLLSHSPPLSTIFVHFHECLIKWQIILLSLILFHTFEIITKLATILQMRPSLSL